MVDPVLVPRKRNSTPSGRKVASYSELRRMLRSVSVVRASRGAVLDARRVVERITGAVVSTCVDVALGSNRKTLTTRCLAKALEVLREKNPVALVPLKQQEDVEAMREELGDLRKKAHRASNPEVKQKLEDLIEEKKSKLDAYLAKLAHWRQH